MSILILCVCGFTGKFMCYLLFIFGHKDGLSLVYMPSCAYKGVK